MTNTNKCTAPISRADAEKIRALQPAIVVSVGRRFGRIVFDRLAKSEKHAWILFDDNPRVVEQVRCSALKVSVIGFHGATVRHDEHAPDKPVNNARMN